MVPEDEDFAKASPLKHKQIQLTGFTDLAGIEPLYYENPYYLQPEATGARTYTLLREALAQTGKAGSLPLCCGTKHRWPSFTRKMMRWF